MPGKKPVNAKRSRKNLASRPPVLLVCDVDHAWPEHDIREAVTETSKLQRAMRRAGHKVNMIQMHDARLAEALRPYDPAEWIIFNWCESLPGVEQGEVQAARIMQEMGFTYTGASPEVLEMNWDKNHTKEMLVRAGVPTPGWRFCDKPVSNGWQQYPAIVKLAHEHCSTGMTSESVVTNQREMQLRVRYMLDKFQQPVLIEDFVDGREFHVTLWGNGDGVRMLPPVEMDFSALGDVHDRLCTHDAKFNPNSFHYREIGSSFSPRLTQEEWALLERTCVQAYRTAGCRDYARLDLRLRNGIFYVLDVNPNSDLTSEASTAYTAAMAGYSYGAMGSHITGLAAQRHPRFNNPPSR